MMPKPITVFIIQALLTWAVSVLAAEKSDHLAIIVGKASSLDSVSASDLQKIFRAQKTRCPDGNRIVLVMRDTGQPEREAALREIYKMSEAEFQRYFLQATFTGTVQAAPRTLPSAQAVKKFIADTPGAIGYIRGDEVDDTVKAISVDGKVPGDPDYGLKISSK
jgi:ABC-type phosphate transport system substrate-binding protein